MTDIRDNKERIEYANQILKKQFNAKKKKMTDCQYMEKDGSCRATTNQQCLNCNFYSPTFGAKLRMLAADLLVTHQKFDDMKREKESAAKQVRHLNNVILRNQIIESCHHGEM